MSASAQLVTPRALTRQVLTVLVADIVGYARLMETLEEETHRRARELHVSVIDPLVVYYRGWIVKNTGDGFIASFESPVDATQCALSLQDEVERAEAPHPPERRIHFRLGVNLDEVIREPEDIFGRGVNIAARLQQAAPAGGIVISSAVHEALQSRVPGEWTDLGELRLKNMTLPVRAFARSGPGLEGTPTARPPDAAPGRARLPTCAVLPLRNLSADEHDAYFAHGIIEDIIVTLSALKDVFVIARGSTLALRRDDLAPPVSRSLGVRYVLGGSLRRQGDELRITVELTDEQAGTVLWADRHECRASDVFDLQDLIVGKVVKTIAAHVREAEVQHALRKRPENLDAYDLFLQALDQLYRLDFASFSRARSLLDRAIESDASYAAAYAYAAQWHIFNVGQGWSTDPEADGRAALLLAQRATECDGLNSLALSIYAHTRSMLFRDYDAALETFEQALAVSPSDNWAWALSSVTLGYVGEAAPAVSRAERAIRLSPMDRYAFYKYCALAQNHYLAATYDEAAIWARKSLGLNSRFGNALRIRAASLVALGNINEARAVAEYFVKIQPSFRLSEYFLRCPFKDPGAVSKYIERLTIAGLPR